VTLVGIHLLLLLSFSILRPPPSSTLFPYTTLFRSSSRTAPSLPWRTTNPRTPMASRVRRVSRSVSPLLAEEVDTSKPRTWAPRRSEEHTSELQSRENLVCRLLLEKKKKKKKNIPET